MKLPAKQCLAMPLGLVNYIRAWELQKTLHRRVADGQLSNLLLLVEHPHVYTLGRRGHDLDILASPEQLAELEAQVHSVDRGGQATYHGPGQLVGYPIVNLRQWGGGPLEYVRTLERVLVNTLAEFGIEGRADDKPTGVWSGDAKIAAIGVKISRGVTMHGFALNVRPNLSHFGHIVPCGDLEGKVASMSSELLQDVSVDAVIPVLCSHFGAAFKCTMEWAEPPQISVLLGNRNHFDQ